MKKQVKDHFNAHAESWVENSYQGWGHVYPTALHRADVLCGIFANTGQGLRIADLGCGAGNLAVRLATEGHDVTGVDQAENMIGLAEARAADAGAGVQGRVRFHHAELEDPGLPAASFDAAYSMGVIGYLESDDPLFATAAKILKPGGLLCVSARNRLFNIASPSYRTTRDAEAGATGRLIEEMSSYYRQVPEAETRDFLRRLAAVATELAEAPFEGLAPERTERLSEEPVLEARQHTPKDLAGSAERFGFRLTGLHGVHPHLIDPNLNRLLAPGVFNALCSALEPMAHLPVSMAWSSAFIGVFEYAGGESADA
ncbi:MAG: methyltransferase domain-containing protein [Rhodospirillales bacterium]|nr:methyltransferase domain-containing protein [Rhodospirillales bacterium]